MATPSVPVIFKRPLVMREEIELHWSEPASGPVLEYRLQCASPVLSVLLSPSTSYYTVRGLTEGQEYTFTIQARNVNGWGAVATWPSVTTGIRPGNVSDLSGNRVGPHAIITWTPATQNGNSPIKYQVLYAYAYDFNGNRVPADDKSKTYKTDITSAVVTNFTMDRDYKIYVKAVNDVGYSFSRQEGPYIQLHFEDMYNLVPTVKSTLGSAGMTQFIFSSEDDTFENRSIPFNLTFNNNTYSDIYFTSNTYLTFGSGTSQFGGVTLGPNASPSIPGIHFGTADNSWQRVYDISGTNVYRLRYEGSASTTGTVGSPNIVYEVTFFKQQNPSDDIYVEIVFGIHNRPSGVFGMTDGNASSAVYTDFANDLSIPITPNNSYVLVLNPDGTFKQLLDGYHIETNLV